MWRLSRDKQKEDTRHLQARACWGQQLRGRSSRRIVLEQILLSLLRRKERHLCLYTNFWGERWDFICSFTGNKIMRKRKKENKKGDHQKDLQLSFLFLFLMWFATKQVLSSMTVSLFPRHPPLQFLFPSWGGPYPPQNPMKGPIPEKELLNYGIGSAVWFVLILVITFMGC